MSVAQLSDKGKMAQIIATLEKKLRYAAKDERRELSLALELALQVRDSISKGEKGGAL